MESKIKTLLEQQLDPERVFGLKRYSPQDKPIITKIEKLGLGQSNLNYLVHLEMINNSNTKNENNNSNNNNRVLLNVRISMSFNEKAKRDEFSTLQLLQGSLGIAPKAYLYEPNKELLGAPFMILEFLPGTDLEDEVLSIHLPFHLYIDLIYHLSFGIIMIIGLPYRYRC